MDISLQQKMIDGCRRGSAKAQQQLFETYRNKVFAVCLRYGRDRPEAQDMLQEAFLAIFKDLGQYRGEGVLEGWLRKVAVRSALQFLRKRNPLRFAEDYANQPLDAAISVPDADLMSESILRFVQELPIGYRTIFNMHCIEGWPYPEIAAELQISESSVRSQYSRACKQLRSSIEKHLLTDIYQD